MAELDRNTPHPTEIKLHQKSRMLEISFADGNTFRLPCEFLRVYSPSAEVRGHGPGQEVLQVGKKAPTATVRGSIPGIFSTTTDSARKKCGGNTSSAWRELERAVSPRVAQLNNPQSRSNHLASSVRMGEPGSQVLVPQYV